MKDNNTLHDHPSAKIESENLSSALPLPDAPLSAPRKRVRKRYLLVGSLGIIVVVLGGFFTLSIRSFMTGQTTPAAYSFSQARCPFKPGTGIIEGKDLTCGYLTVPEDSQHPGKRHLKLAVAIFKARIAHPLPDPMVYLSGGPGGALLSDVGPLISIGNPNGVSLEDITLGHDLILMDQRGIGYSQPSLSCPEIDTYNKDTMNVNLSQDALSAGYNHAMQQCYNRLAAAGINFNAYTTENDAADFHDLIHALGYKQANLYGVSYGTRLALTMMRLFPADLHSVILDSTLPPQANLFSGLARVTQHAYDTFFQGCAASPTCQQEYPQLQSIFYQLIDTLNKHPVTFQDLHVGKVLLTGDNLANWLFSSLYVTNFIPYLPMAIYQVYSGNYSLISRFYGELMYPSSNSLSYAMSFSVQCGEEMPFASQQQLIQSMALLRPQLRAAMVSNLLSSYQICQFWGEKPVDAQQKLPVQSSLPTLILSGEYDPITPTANARLAQQTLPKSYLVVFPGTGHGAFLSDPCPGTIMEEFMLNPQQKPDDSCLATMQEPNFQ
jgi:pimeloyl-ACP methyl ester carboxylesterase